MKQSESTLREAMTHLNAGQFAEASSICQEVLRFDPKSPDALYIMGIVSHQGGNLEEATQYLGQSIEVNQDNFYAQEYMAMLLIEQGYNEEAISYLQKALAINPVSESTHYNLGTLLSMLGKDDAAIEHFRAAIKYKPDYIAAYHSLGNLLQKAGAYSDALTQYNEVIKLNPALPEAHQNLGLIYHAMKEHEKAIECFNRALEINPDNDNVHFLIGTSCILLDENDDAETHFLRAIEINPDNTVARCNMGFLYVQQLKLDDAMAAFRQAIEKDSSCAEGYYGMAKVTSRLGQPEKTISMLREALQAKPDYVDAYQSLLMHLHYSPEHSVKNAFTDHLAFSYLFEKPLSQYSQPHTNTRDTGRKLRIGYVSPDLKRHSVFYFIEPVLAYHDKDKFEIYLYHNNIKEDDLSEKLKGLADHWHNIAGFTDEQVVEHIRNEQIDILVDLAGHTLGNRLLVFARKPAPVQLTWIGYPGTTGLTSIDYRITDHYADPIGEADELHSEKLVRLPECFSTYRPPAEAFIEECDLPVNKNGYITFGSFNNLSKVNSGVIEQWSSILEALPTARLVLKHEFLSADTIAEETLQSFESYGIDRSRLTLLGRMPTYQEHMACYNDIDIALDTFPYNGTTTTCEALWMGIPVIVLKGDNHASRVGYSLLENLGCTELVASNVSEYVEIAVNLTSNVDALKKYRSELRERLTGSPLMNGERFTKSYESELQAMWVKWCETGDEEIATPAIDIESAKREARTLHNARRLTDLEPICRSILEVEKNDVEAMHLLGLSLRAQGKKKEACDYLCAAAAAAPDNKTILSAAADELLSLEHFRPAINLYEKLLDIESDSDSVYNHIGFCYYGIGKLKNALKYYKKALQINPDNVNVLNNLGIVLLERGKKKIANTFFKRAISIDPGYYQAYYHQHIATFSEDDPADAIKALRLSVETNPQNLLAKSYLAMWLDFTGENEESTRLFNEIENVTGELSFLADSWNYVQAHRTENTRLFTLSFDGLRHAFANTMDEGLILEFGVREGNSINFISRHTNSPVHGFDSFEGLPESWEGMKKGLYTTNSELPQVNSNVTLYKGWFENTLPGFCKNNQGNIRFMNVDCDIYSSTRTIFEHLGDRIVPGSVIIFDEYISNPNWRNDEYKAFQEFVSENDLDYEYILFSPFNKQAAVIIK